MKPIFKSVLRIPSFRKEEEELSVAEIVEAVEELDQSRTSRISTDLLSSKSSNTQFHATRRWNKLIRKFYEKMPKRKHRGLILSYENTFTGKSAVQFLVATLFPEIVPNKPVDETNAIKFMEVLLKKNLVENVKSPESQLFISKAIYRFITVNVAAEIEATSLKRSNSITNLKAAANNFNSSFRTAATPNRRISKSCSNLHTLLKSELKIEENTSKNPFKVSKIIKPTLETAAEESEVFGKAKSENNYFQKQVNGNRYSNLPMKNEFLSSPSTSSSTTYPTIPTSSNFSISTFSSSSKSIKRGAADFEHSPIPFKRVNQRPMSYYDRSSNVCETPSKAEEYLLLLDSLIADEMLTENQRQRKLAGFQKTYPEIYLIRFPEAAFTPKVQKPRHPTPIRVLQKLIRRNSAKRK